MTGWSEFPFEEATRLEALGLLGPLMAPLPEVRGERYKPKAF